MRKFPILLSCIIITLCLAACGNKTPEDRMNMAREYMSQRDMLSAESELRKIVDKTPDDPMAMQARYHLAQIYTQERRFDEAVQELEVIIDEVPQVDPLAMEAFRLYLTILSQLGQFDKALARIDQLEKEYENDKAMALNLKVGRANLLINAKRTTDAREILLPLLEETTHAQTAQVYTDLMVQSYELDQNTTAGIEFLEKRYQETPVQDTNSLMPLAVRLAVSYANLQDYDNTRKYVQAATKHYDEALQQEVQPQIRAQIASDMAALYQEVGNLPGAEVIYQAFLEAGIPELIAPSVSGLAIIRVRNGDTSAAIELFREYGEKYPQSGLATRADQLETMGREGTLAAQAPVDTSTLTLRFREDSTITLQNFSADALSTQPRTAENPPQPVTETQPEATDTTGPETGSQPVNAVTTVSLPISDQAVPSTATEPVVSSEPSPTPDVTPVADSPAEEPASVEEPASQDTEPTTTTLP